MKAYLLIEIRTGEIPKAIRQLRSTKGIAAADLVVDGV